MKITEISIGVARTFNTGNYENIKVEASVTASVDNLDNDLDKVRETLIGECREGIKKTYQDIRNGAQKNGE